MAKVKLNYILDLIIALAFVLAALTGIAFLFLGSDGYQGGRNAGFNTTWLGIQRTVWSDLHTLSSLVMIAGIAIHIVFHWRWISCVTKQMLPKLPVLRKAEKCEVISS